MKKILIIITTGFESTGGLTTVMMNYYRAMDKTSFRIDFASTNEAECVLINELSINDSNYYCLGNRKKEVLHYIRNLRKLINKKQYDIVHINGNSATMLIETSVAKSCHVKRIICHTHTTQSEYPVINRILLPIFRNSYTYALAVSDKAGKWLYGKDYTVLNNAINTSKYAYNSEHRSTIKMELGIEGKYVIGTVGKLTSSKNQAFLIDVFMEYMKTNSNAVLLIVGGGELENELKKKALECGLAEYIIFLGMRDDVERVIQCFDVFVFTSKYEGFGMVLVEAQASGLHCIVADTIPKETAVTNNIEYMSLNAPIRKWVDRIEYHRNNESDRTRLSMDACKSIEKHGFNIVCEAKKLREVYETK